MTGLTMSQLDDRLGEFKVELNRYFASADLAGKVNGLDGWRKKVNADGSFGRILNGPQWLDGVAIRDNTVTVDKLTANMIFTKILTLSAGGYIIDDEGSKWDNTGITLVSAGVFGDAIKWQVAGADKGSLYADASVFTMGYPSGSTLHLSSTQATLGAGSSGDNALQINTTDVQVRMGGFDPSHVTFEATNKRARFGGYIYPGDGSTSPSQSTRYIRDDGTSIDLHGITLVTGTLTTKGRIFPGKADDSAAQATTWIASDGGFVTVQLQNDTTSAFDVVQNAGNHMIRLRADGRIMFSRASTVSGPLLTNASGAMPNPTQALHILDDGGNSKYIAVFSNHNAWTA